MANVVKKNYVLIADAAEYLEIAEAELRDQLDPGDIIEVSGQQYITKATRYQKKLLLGRLAKQKALRQTAETNNEQEEKPVEPAGAVDPMELQKEADRKSVLTARANNVSTRTDTEFGGNRLNKPVNIKHSVPRARVTRFGRDGGVSGFKF